MTLRLIILDNFINKIDSNFFSITNKHLFVVRYIIFILLKSQYNNLQKCLFRKQSSQSFHAGLTIYLQS